MVKYGLLMIGLWLFMSPLLAQNNFSPGDDGTLFWSPDGSYLYFTAYREIPSLWRLSLEDNTAELLLEDFYFTNSPLSPDGQRLIVKPANDLQLYLFDLEIFALMPLAIDQNPVVTATWSPTGTALMLEVILPSGSREAYIADANGENASPIVSLSEIGVLFWANRDNALVLLENNPESPVFQILELSADNTIANRRDILEVLRQQNIADCCFYTIVLSPDNNELVVTLPDDRLGLISPSDFTVLLLSEPGGFTTQIHWLDNQHLVFNQTMNNTGVYYADLTPDNITVEKWFDAATFDISPSGSYIRVENELWTIDRRQAPVILDVVYGNYGLAWHPDESGFVAALCIGDYADLYWFDAQTGERRALNEDALVGATGDYPPYFCIGGGG